MEYIVNDGLLDEFESDPEGTFIHAFAILDVRLGDNASEWGSIEHDQILEVVALLEALVEAGLIDAKDLYSPIDGVGGSSLTDLYNYLSRASELIKNNQSLKNYNSLKNRLVQRLSGGFYYEFSEGDLSKIQSLINELREKISASTDFDPNHRQRLLKRLEAIQREIHKKVADMDRLWGLVGDAGVAMGKFGENAKPIVDRIKEIAEIVWRTQARAEELPSGSSFPLLGSSAKKEDESE